MSKDYFNGVHSYNGWRHSTMFHRTDPEMWYQGLIDRGVYLTRDGWQSHIGHNQWGGMTTDSPFPPSHRTVQANAMHPDYDERPIALAVIERTSSGYLVVNESEDPNNPDWSSPDNDDPASYKGSVPFVGFDHGNPSRAYWAKYRSTDHGHRDSWKRIQWLDDGGYEIVGMTRTRSATHQAVFAYDRRGEQRHIARSLDGGDTWEVVLDFDLWGYNPMDLPGNRGKGIFQAHDSDPDRIWLAGPPGGSAPGGRSRHELRLVRLDEGSPDDRPYEEIDLVPENIRTDLHSGADFFADQLAIDPRHPDVMYVTNGNIGTGVALIRSTNRGETWENLTGIVHDSRKSGIGVHPLTGDFLLSSPNGMFLMPPPYEEPASLFYNRPHPVTDRILSHGDAVPVDF